MNTCVCCGAIIPEGTQVCWKCSRSYRKITYKTNILKTLARNPTGFRRRVVHGFHTAMGGQMMNHDYDYDFSTCIELKRVPKNIWDCDIDKLKNAESIFLESCETMSRFMSTQYFELTANKCKDESLCDAVKRQKEYWSKDIPDAMRELISTLMEYSGSEPKQNQQLFMLNLPKYFCKDPTKFFNCLVSHLFHLIF